MPHNRERFDQLPTNVMRDEQVLALVRQMRRGGPLQPATQVMPTAEDEAEANSPAPVAANPPPVDSGPTTVYRVGRSADAAMVIPIDPPTLPPTRPPLRANPPPRARTALKVLLGALLFAASVYVGHRTRPTLRAHARAAAAAALAHAPAR